MILVGVIIVIEITKDVFLLLWLLNHEEEC
jgi:hypothetical protein